MDLLAFMYKLNWHNLICWTRKHRQTKQYWVPALKGFGVTYQPRSGADYAAFKKGHVPLETTLLLESEG